MQNCDQSCTNFQFSKFKVQGLDIATLLGVALRSSMFSIYWNFRGSFFNSIFGFWKFLNCILNQNSHFWRGLFYKTFWFEASWYMFLIFFNFRESFFNLIFGFWKFKKCILNQNSHFGWGLFYKTFWLEASLYIFNFLEL